MQYAVLVYNHPPGAETPGENGVECDTSVLADPCVKSYVRLKGADLATTVRTAGERIIVSDGPFAETKEIFGGIIVIDVDDMDAALEFATRASRVARAIEVRPMMD